MELVIAEKPSVAQSIAAVLGATQRKDGYLEGNEYLVSWCVGHLVELAQPESYEEAWKKWSYESLPIQFNNNTALERMGKLYALFFYQKMEENTWKKQM